jgi:hypothetical protein
LFDKRELVRSRRGLLDLKGFNLGKSNVGELREFRVDGRRKSRREFLKGILDWVVDVFSILTFATSS